MATTKRREKTPSFRGYTVIMMGAAVPMASPHHRTCETESEFQKRGKCLPEAALPKSKGQEMCTLFFFGLHNIIMQMQTLIVITETVQSGTCKSDL